MKKLILSAILVAGTFILFSCVKTCTCEDPKGKIKEIEIDPSEKCSKHNSLELGECS